MFSFLLPSRYSVVNWKIKTRRIHILTNSENTSDNIAIGFYLLPFIFRFSPLDVLNVFIRHRTYFASSPTGNANARNVNRGDVPTTTRSSDQSTVADRVDNSPSSGRNGTYKAYVACNYENLIGKPNAPDNTSLRVFLSARQFPIDGADSFRIALRSA